MNCLEALTLIVLVLLSQLICHAASTRPDTNPLFIPSVEVIKQRIESELHVTLPEHVVFVPQVTDAGVSDTGNEHFLVFSDG